MLGFVWFSLLLLLFKVHNHRVLGREKKIKKIIATKMK